MKLVHWYDQTPAQLFAQHKVVHDAHHATLRLEDVPFANVPKLPWFGDNRLSYQLALSDCALNHEVIALREAYPTVPRSGDRDKRSGIIVFDGNRIIGSFILTGHSPTVPYIRLVVAPEWGSQGIATRMLVEWGSRFVRQVDSERASPIVITTRTAHILLAAHAEIVAADPDIVPPEVLAAVVKGDEARSILKASNATRQVHVAVEFKQT